MINKIRYIVITLCVIIILIFIEPFTKGFINSEFFKYNLKYLDEDIILVAIDQKTLNDPNFKRYGDLNRSDYADVLEKISYGGPKAIGVDIVFINKSSNEIEDKRLQEVLDKYKNIFIGTEIEVDKNIKEIKPNFSGNFGHVNINGYKGFINLYGIDLYNSIPLFNLDKNLNVSLPLSISIYKYLHKDFDINTIPTVNGSLQINFFANIDEYKAKGKVVSFIDVINGNIDYNIFKDKIIFIGSTAQDLHDEFLTPYASDQFMPGVLIHANAYNTISSGKFIKYQGILGFIITNFLFLILIIYLNTKNQNINAIFYSSVAIILFIILSFLGFIILNYFTDVFTTIVGFILLNLVIFLDKYIQERKTKDAIKNVFSKYVSEDIVNQIIQVGLDKLHLGGQDKYITLFFSDLAGFTDLSENLQPQELGMILNIYFEEMSNIILSTGGTIDKFIGDAIMAFWNAPFDVKNHEDMACKTAILQRKALQKIREELIKIGANVNIDMRIGINTGNAVIGNFGSSKRYDYTALGDTVNLASRLESINKQYGTNIIISEDTYNGTTKEMFITRDLDLITVKGKTKPVKIFELIDFKEFETKEIIEKIKIFEAGLKLYREAKFGEAKQVFEKIQNVDAPSKVFVKRCEEFINQNLSNFDGVYRFKVK